MTPLQQRVDRVFTEGEKRFGRVGDRTTVLRFHHPETGQLVVRTAGHDARHFDDAVGRQDCELEVRKTLWFLLGNQGDTP